MVRITPRVPILKHVLHLLHANLVQRGGLHQTHMGPMVMEVVEDLTPCCDVHISLRLARPVRRVTLEPQGVEIPFQEAASSGATTTQFKKAVLSLTVTPQITPDDRIIMDLEVTQDTVGQFVPSATGGLVPSIDTRKVITQVLVNDGETVVLGGIFETERRDSEDKVPFLGDIPGLGRLFKRTSSESNKRELLIFVTPKILREGSNIY
jgi:type IV pilus assembly protein PilQ